MKSTLIFMFLAQIFFCSSLWAQTEIPYTLEEFKNLAQDSFVACANARDCPAHVGLFLGAELQAPEASATQEKNYYSKITCTAFQISPSVAVTNAHCIPKELSANSVCDQRIFLRFSDQKLAECARILFVGTRVKAEGSEYYEPDLALFSLRENHGSPAIQPTAAVDVAVSDPIKIYKVNPSNGSHAWGVLEARRCQLSHRSFAFPGFVGVWDPIRSVENCDIRAGNSGSPVLDQLDRWVGTISSTIPLEYRKAFSAYLLEGEMPDEAYFVNARCWDLSDPNRPLLNDSPDCHKAHLAPQKLQPSTALLLQGNQQVNHALDRWVSENVEAQEFEWELTVYRSPQPWDAKKYMSQLGPVPRCLKKGALARMPPQDPRTITRWRMQVPRWSVRMGINEESRWEIKVQESSEEVMLNLQSGNLEQSRFPLTWLRLQSSEKDEVDNLLLLLEECRPQAPYRPQLSAANN